jgi:hypothetical protein
LQFWQKIKILAAVKARYTEALVSSLPQENKLAAY